MIVVDRIHDRFPTFGFDLLSRARAAIVVGSHLREDSVPQTQRRIAKTLQAQAFYNFVIDDGPGDDDFCPPRPNTLDLTEFGYWKARQSFGNAGHLRSRHGISL